MICKSKKKPRITGDLFKDNQRLFFLSPNPTVKPDQCCQIKSTGCTCPCAGVTLHLGSALRTKCQFKTGS